MQTGSISSALAAPTDASDDVFTLYMLVTERHQDHPLEDLARPQVVAGIEQALAAEWDIDVPWTLPEWTPSLYTDDQDGAIRQSVMFTVWFETPAASLYDSLLATGLWFEHEDFPPEPDRFFLYSATARLQADANGDETTVIVTAGP